MEYLKRYYIYFLVFIGGFGALYYFSYSFSQEPVLYVSTGRQEEQTQSLPPPVRHISTPEAVKGIYMTSWVAGTKNWREELIGFMDRTEINSVVIDIKDYTGRVSFNVYDDKLNSLGYSESRIPDVRNFINYLHGKNIYVIGRISVFQDPHLVRVRPDLAVRTKSGSVWKDRKGISWIDPASEEMWDLTVRIAKEAEKVGFDELQFDYIRFPSDGNMTDIAYPFGDPKKTKAQTLKEFFAYLDENLKDIDIPISADLFGLTSSSNNDLNIGQILENALAHFDYVSPMVYPSHYPTTFKGYKNPALYPYEVIKSEMEAASAKAVLSGEDPGKIRPWIQDFDLGANYDSAMIRLEKKAVYDSGLTSWLAWDPSNRYTREAYDLEEPTP